MEKLQNYKSCVENTGQTRLWSLTITSLSKVSTSQQYAMTPYNKNDMEDVLGSHMGGPL